VTRETPAALLVTSNGVGMGHLARQAALASAALRPPSGPPLLDPVLLSMSAALPTVLAAGGLRGEYCPGVARRWMRPDRWHRYLDGRLVALVRELGARVVVFDGVSPYPGVLSARRRLPEVAFVWSRRGLWQPGASRAPLHSRPYFDLVVTPGDIAAEADRGPTAGLVDGLALDPVTLLETEQRLGRAAAARELGLDPDRPTLLVGLGAGALDDPSGRAAAAVRAGLDHPDWQVGLVQSPLVDSTLPDELAGRVVPLRGVFPLVRYLAAFDAAASSGGYNSVHELVLGGVPTLLVPSRVTSTDDQPARAGYAAARGWALVAEDADPATVAAGVRRLLSDGARAELAAATAGFPAPTGAGTAAGLAAELASADRGAARVVDPYRPVRAGSVALRRLVGETTWERARRAAGGPPRTLARGPQPVVESDGELPEGTRRLVVTDDVDAMVAHPDDVVEHLLPGTSPAYHEQRRGLLPVAYDLVRPATRDAGRPLRILVVTVVHHPHDARILYREVAALRAAGHEVTYAAPFTAYDAKPPDDMKTVDLPRASGRRRGTALFAARALLRREAATQDMVLLHDPELLAAAAGLRLPPVVWDVHEDTAAAVTLKPWLPVPLRPATASAFRAIESGVERNRHLVLAEPGYAQRFRRSHPVVPNSTVVPREVPPPGRDRVVYLGALTRARGAFELVELGRLLRGSGVRVEVIGSADPEVTAALAAADAAGEITWHGFVPNDRAVSLLEGSLAGLSLLHDEANYRHSRPTKVIEYMAHGIPVVTTPTPPAAELVAEEGCGVVVPFGTVAEVAAAAADAVTALAAEHGRAVEMGRRGHAAALARYDWAHDGAEFVRLLEGWA
jgi:glycosyltransferase involved in cell wall biosynthesis